MREIFKNKGRSVASVFFSVLFSLLAVVLVAQAATTISTNISTGGTLTVNGASTFGDAATDLNLSTGTPQASTTSLFTSGLSTYGNSIFGDASTDTNLFTGTLQASTTALFTGDITLYGGASGLTFSSSATTTVGFNSLAGINFDSNLFVIDPNADRLGVASSSPAQEFGVVGDVMIGSSATTTLQITSSSATKGGCIELKGADGSTIYRIYATSTGPINAEVGTCQ